MQTMLKFYSSHNLSCNDASSLEEDQDCTLTLP